MLLRTLLEKSGLLAQIGETQADLDREITSIAYDSRKVEPGSLFVAIEGFTSDGHDFIDQAIGCGAEALLVSKAIEDKGITTLQLEDARAALALLAQAFYGDPSADLRVVGITGTNGKTTTTYLLDAILKRAGVKTGLIGTVQTRLDTEVIESTRTTPESLEIQSLLSQARTRGIDTVTMEVSSHAIELKRVDALHFTVVAFTNISQDHLDFHADMDEYFAAKKKLFLDYDAYSRVICMESDEGFELYEELKGFYNAFTVGRHTDYDLFASDEIHNADSTEFVMHWNGTTERVLLPIPGAYNVENALVAAGIALSLGVELPVIAEALSTAPQVPGRLQRVNAGQDFVVAVDYAHTPDSIEKAIEAMREVSSGKIIAVFGCGGDRDPLKRPKMAFAAAKADLAIATSDNPRSEDPAEILKQVEEALIESGAHYASFVSRAEAIAHAIKSAEKDDVVLILGKGHETYQIFADETIHFDDAEEALKALEARGFSA